VVSGDGKITVTYDLNLIVGMSSSPISGLAIYPNPVKDLVYLDGIRGSAVVEVRNILGSVVKLMNVEQEGVVTISMADLSSGVYFIRIYTEYDKQAVTFRAVKR
jgi:hypothetical protein